MIPIDSQPDRSVQSKPAATRRPRAARPMKATILGTGGCPAERAIDNRYFVETLGLDTSADWIERKTGIVERRWAGPGQSAVDLATVAAQRALAQAELPAARLDVIVVATSTPDHVMPSTACLVQQRLGATQAMAFDLHNACAGFVYAFDAAVRYLQTGAAHALVIGVDLGSRLVSPRDRGTCVFFGDGAGAVALSRKGGGRMLATRMYSRGDVAPLCVPTGGFMSMDGRAIWDFAIETLPATVRELCSQARVPVEGLRLLVPHQANRNILHAAAEKLGLPIERVAVNIEHYGNTLAASIPLVLDEALRDGRAGRGDLAALVGFGAGLAWGGVLLEL